jgi:hypothetical protein
MSTNKQRVDVLVLISMLVVTFEAIVEKRQDGLYTLATDDFSFSVALKASEMISFSPEGGLFISRNDVAVTIEPLGRTPEELLTLYPDSSKFIH